MNYNENFASFLGFSLSSLHKDFLIEREDKKSSILLIPHISDLSLVSLTEGSRLFSAGTSQLIFPVLVIALSLTCPFRLRGGYRIITDSNVGNLLIPKQLCK